MTKCNFARQNVDDVKVGLPKSNGEAPGSAPSSNLASSKGAFGPWTRHASIRCNFDLNAQAASGLRLEIVTISKLVCHKHLTSYQDGRLIQTPVFVKSRTILEEGAKAMSSRVCCI